MTIKQALRKLTRSNRRTPEQIAAYLKRKGFRGQRRMGTECVLAVFYKAHGIDVPHVMPSGSKAGDDLRVRHPDSVRTFVGRFDEGWFPDLVED